MAVKVGMAEESSAAALKAGKHMLCEMPMVLPCPGVKPWWRIKGRRSPVHVCSMQ